MDRQKKGKIQRIGTIGLWIVAIGLGLGLNFWYLAAFIFLLHLAELFIVGLKKGRLAGISLPKTILMVLVFGFTWWLYLETA